MPEHEALREPTLGMSISGVTSIFPGFGSAAWVSIYIRFYANLSHYQLIRQGDTLLYRVLECRVQQARTRKNLGLHPCKPAGLAEYAGFAKTIDGRITCQCLSCCPEVTDPGCACAWLFRLKGENSPAATGEFAGLSGKHGENFRQNDG